MTEPMTTFADIVADAEDATMGVGPFYGDAIEHSDALAAAILADPRLVDLLAGALHQVDDDVQFIRRDARNFPVLAGRIIRSLGGTK